ncbi:MAG: phage tail tape measure protein [Muribaculaceae bacterium]|nr:phage tail tape measure protein [Muribaculaceae bacterium]
MAVIRNLVVKIAADISSLSKGLQTAQKQIQKVSATFTKVGTKLTASITAPLVALGAAAVNVSQGFEQSMANAASVAGATGDELARMTALAREMGSKTVFSASDAADALYYMASAGYKVDQMADSIEATLNLASATQSDLAFTTDTVISTLNQFGLEANQAERVTNVFAAAIGNSMANMDKLSNSMGYVGPVANSLGYEIEEVTGALAVLYNAGYDGSTAGTSLRQSLVSLMNPTSSALAAFEELGLSFEDVNPATNDLATIIDRLGDAGMDTSQAMKVFGARAGPGMLALMSEGGDAVRDMTASITGTSKASEMAEVQLDTLQGQVKILKSEIEEIAISFGDVLIPIIRQFIQKYISPLTAKLMGLSMGTKKNIVTIALLAAAIGPLLLVVGKLIGSVGTIMKIGSLLFSKTGLIIAAIAAVVGVVTYLWKTNEDFRNAVARIWEKIKSAILKAVNTIKAWWSKNGEKIIGAVIKALKVLWNGIKAKFNLILKIAQKVWPYVKMIVVDTVNAIKQFWEKNGAKIWNTVKTIFTNIWTCVKAAFSIIGDALNKFFSYVKPIWEKLKALFASLWDTICELYETLKPIFDLIGGLVMTLWGVVSSVLGAIIDALGPFLEAVIDVVSAILDIIKIVCAVLRGDWASAWEYMQDFAGNIWSAIKNIFLGIWEFIKGFGQNIVSFFTNCGETIGNIFKSVWEGISGFFVNIWDGICSVCGWIWDKITGLFSSIGDFFTNLFKDAFNWGKNLISNIADGIESAWNWVVDGVKGIGQSIADFLGFGSPTKKGPGHKADEWIPNLLDMMADDMYANIPMMQRAAIDVANTLGLAGSPNRAIVGTGSNPNGDLINGLLQGIMAMQGMGGADEKELVLQIDGQTLARLMMPKLSREYKRNGVNLAEV